MKLVASLTSPYARKIRVALAEKSLPFELEVDIPWLADTRVPSYNPLGKVPALVADDGELWFDSPVIAEYLDTLAGPAAPVTLDDVARLSGVSRSTASRVINGQPGVRPDVRERVQRIADHVGFRPNRAAKQLASGRAEAVGLVPVASSPSANKPWRRALPGAIAR